MKSGNNPRYILGVVVAALFFFMAWGATSARLSTTTNRTAVEATAGGIVKSLQSPSGPSFRLDEPRRSSNLADTSAFLNPANPAPAIAPFAPPAANLDQVRNGS